MRWPSAGEVAFADCDRVSAREDAGHEEKDKKDPGGA